jgi:hypothetical protein
VPFRKVQEQVNELEHLILVTPDFADAMDPCDVPPCGPGMETMSPSSGELYWKGMIEVPSCGPCGASEPCICPAPGQACNLVNGGAGCGPNGCYNGAPNYGATNYQYAPAGVTVMATDGLPPGAVPVPSDGMITPTPADPTLPGQPALGPQLEPIMPGNVTPPDPAASLAPPQWQSASRAPLDGSIPGSARSIVSEPSTSTPGLIGPIGYDVEN